MAKYQNRVWIGKGVLKVGSKLIGEGEPIPSEVDEDRVKELVALGCIGKAPVEKVEPSKDAVDPDLAAIVGKKK